MKQFHGESKLSILRNRACVLAKVPETAAGNLQCLEILEFRLAAETYGMETKYIREVYPLKDFTPIPGAPSFVLGLANVRGRILSVIDLQKFLNYQLKGLGELNRIIIVQNDFLEFGMLADVLIGVRKVMLKDIQASPSKVLGAGEQYLKGITKERMAVLEMGSILKDEQMIVNVADRN